MLGNSYYTTWFHSVPYGHSAYVQSANLFGSKGKNTYKNKGPSIRNTNDKCHHRQSFRVICINGRMEMYCTPKLHEIYFPVLGDFRSSEHPPTSRSKIKKRVELYPLYLHGMLWGDHSCQPILIYKCNVECHDFSPLTCPFSEAVLCSYCNSFLLGRY